MVKSFTSLALATALAALSLTGCADWTLSPTGSHDTQSPSAASASPVPSPSPSSARVAVSTRTAPATVRLGEPIQLATMGPLRYTITVSNLRTGIESDTPLYRPRRGQWILLDVTLSADNADLPMANGAIFQLLTSDGARERANTFGGVKGADVDLGWIRMIKEGTSFTGQVMIDAPVNLEGARIVINEIDVDVAFWTLP